LGTLSRLDGTVTIPCDELFGSSTRELLITFIIAMICADIWIKVVEVALKLVIMILALGVQ